MTCFGGTLAILPLATTHWPQRGGSRSGVRFKFVFVKLILLYLFFDAIENVNCFCGRGVRLASWRWVQFLPSYAWT
jgi:hypothetical protein